MTEADKLPNHLDWLVNSRNENQRVALRLLRLLQQYPNECRRIPDVAQELVSVAFSLWRAAFLADKIDGQGRGLEDAKAFLERVLLDNAINYPQERSTRNWTFSYYLQGARFQLEQLAKRWPGILTPKVEGRSPTIRWDYYHRGLSRAVERFAGELEQFSATT